MSKTRTFLYFHLHYIIYLSVHSLRIRNNVVIDIITHLLAVNIFLNHATDSSAATAVTRAARTGGERERTNRGTNDALLYTLLSLILMTYFSFYKLISSCIRHWRTINLLVSFFVSIEFFVLLRIFLALTECKIRIIRVQQLLRSTAKALSMVTSQTTPTVSLPIHDIFM